MLSWIRLGDPLFPGEMECTGDFTGRLDVLEETKILPAGAVWDYYCQQQNVPVASAGLDAVRTYKREVQCKRS